MPLAFRRTRCRADRRVLGEALLRRKRVTFVYHSMSRDVTEERIVEPYGLVFASAHWYLAGRDVAADALRKFRVSRMRRVVANTKKPQSADFEIPARFQASPNMPVRSRPWELGDDAPEEMVVEIRGDTGAAGSVRSLGAEVVGEPARRRFQVRRVDSFVRWLMSFAGDVVPVSPPRLCEQYRATIAATLATYDGRPSGARMTIDAGERLQRVLRVMPLIVDRDDVPVDEVRVSRRRRRAHAARGPARSHGA